MVFLAGESNEIMEQEAIFAELRSRNPHGSAADMAMSREEIRRVLSSRSDSASRFSSATETAQRPLAGSEETAFRLLNNAMHYLMDRVPMSGPETVFADIQHADMQAAAILARASRELFLPAPQPIVAPASRVSFRERLRMVVSQLGLGHARQSA